jgi:hypothetical protein
MFDRISRSFDLAKSSWQVLRADKKLVVFPIISAVGVLLVLVSFIAPLAVLIAGGQIKLDEQANAGQPAWWVYPLTFAFYFCNYFVIVFCNAALISCALMRFNGEEPTIGDGFRAAGARLPQIVAWAFVSATVGLLLKIVENVHEKIGALISALLGTAWTVITFFVVPVLVVEKLGPFAAIGRSLALLKKAWGEALIGNFGLGLFKFLLILPGLLVLAGGIALCVMVKPIALGLVVVGIGILLLLAASAMGATLDAIFLTALYQYAAFEKVPDGFDRTCIEGAFKRKAA